MRPYDAECLAKDAAEHVLARLPRRFVRREDGTITVFAAVVFVLMVSVGGIAIDLMRFETQRVQLQYTLDRAVLAAAALNQTRPPRMWCATISRPRVWAITACASRWMTQSMPVASARRQRSRCRRCSCNSSVNVS